MSRKGKLMPNLDKKAIKRLNLKVLRRIDPFVKDILMTAGHATFYEFNVDTSQWSRKDVEGSLFVVKRNAQPRFQFIVMNRRNTNNLVENLLGDFEYELQAPYLYYRNASQEANGIWFCNARECKKIANLFSRILNADSKVPTKTKISPTKSEFEELEAVPTLAVIDGPLEPPSTTSSVTDVPDDPSFLNSFSTSINIGNAPNLAIKEQPYHSSATIVSTSRSKSVALPALASTQTPSASSTSTPIMHIIETPEHIPAPTRSTDLVKPSSFFGAPPSSSPMIKPPTSSSMPSAPPFNPPGNQQSSYGAPLLQPFPPPTPPPSLTPTTVTTPNYGPAISREKV